MTTERPRWPDLVSEMYNSVWEEAPLHELPLGSVIRVSADRSIVRGPWQGEECRSVLIPWYVARWIELIADAEPPWSLTPAEWQPRAIRDGAFLVLSKQDGSALLNDSARWVLGTFDGHVMLCCTDEGQLHGYPDWLGLVEKPA